jgi:hypothetical protein
LLVVTDDGECNANEFDKRDGEVEAEHNNGGKTHQGRHRRRWRWRRRIWRSQT